MNKSEQKLVRTMLAGQSSPIQQTLTQMYGDQKPKKIRIKPKKIRIKSTKKPTKSQKALKKSKKIKQIKQREFLSLEILSKFKSMGKRNELKVYAPNTEISHWSQISKYSNSDESIIFIIKANTIKEIKDNLECFNRKNIPGFIVFGAPIKDKPYSRYKAYQKAKIFERMRKYTDIHFSQDGLHYCYFK